MHEKTYLTKSLRLRNKRSRMVSEQRKTEERRGTGFFLIWPREKWNVSLTLIPCSLRRNRSEAAAKPLLSETLATSYAG